MSTWKKIKNWMADLYYWRAERKLTMEENAKLRAMVDAAEQKTAETIASYEVMYQKQDECITALATENAELGKLLDGYVDELMHQRDVNECLWRDWGVKQAELAVAEKKLEKKDDDELRLWAEHKLLLASMLTVNPEEGVRYHV